MKRRDALKLIGGLAAVPMTGLSVSQPNPFGTGVLDAHRPSQIVKILAKKVGERLVIGLEDFPLLEIVVRPEMWSTMDVGDKVEVSGSLASFDPWREKWLVNGQEAVTPMTLLRNSSAAG